jgi:hypothetical protein
MGEKGNVLSRNPNLCASCSSMADGAGEGVSAADSTPFFKPSTATKIRNNLQPLPEVSSEMGGGRNGLSAGAAQRETDRAEEMTVKL